MNLTYFNTNIFLNQNDCLYKSIKLIIQINVNSIAIVHNIHNPSNLHTNIKLNKLPHQKSINPSQPTPSNQLTAQVAILTNNLIVKKCSHSSSYFHPSYTHKYFAYNLYYEEQLNDKIYELNEELNQCTNKYKKLYEKFESNQLQNDKLKIEIFALSENYQNLSMDYSQIKYKYHQLKENQDQFRRKSQQKIYFDQLQLVAKDSIQSNSDRDNQHQYITQQAQAMQYEKEMFLQEIRSSQQQIFTFKTSMEQLMTQKQQLQQQNIELQQLLNGQKGRSDKFDRQILDILNKNQELKIQILQHKSFSAQLNEQIEKQTTLLQQQKSKNNHHQQQKQVLNKQIAELKQTIIQLKFQTSHQRQNYSILQQKQREHKNKINQMKKENQALRIQLQKIINQFNQTSSQLEKITKEQAIHYKSCAEEQKNKIAKSQQQQKQKGHEKMKQISKMHKQITLKLQQKIHLLQKGNKQKKQKNTQLKFQIERLYESLQIQIQKQVKYTQNVKQLKTNTAEVQEENRNIKSKLAQIANSKESAESSLKLSKNQLENVKGKLKKITSINSKLVLHTLPHLKEQLHSIRLLCKHFSSMIEMERQQTKFLLLRSKESLHHLIQQSILQKNIVKQQQNLNYQTDLNKWKENCKLYQEKYSQLNTTFTNLQEKYSKLQLTHNQAIHSFSQKMNLLQEQNQRKRIQYQNTQTVIERLKQKCKEVQQYYKLIEDLSKENISLKHKLQTASYYSFKSPEKAEFDYTSKRRQFTSQQALQKYNQTTNFARVACKNDEINLNDLTAKAEFQRMRLQAAKREYKMLNRNQNQ